MTVPKNLMWPGMSKEDMKRLEARVQAKREIMKKAPAFATKQEAISHAVSLSRKDESSLPSIWKGPADVGNKYAVVTYANRENAQNAGYQEVVDKQELLDLAIRKSDSSIDYIEEVTKFNPYHDAQGRFTTGGGGGGAGGAGGAASGSGAAMSPGERSTAIANAAITQSKKASKSTMSKLKSGRITPDKALDDLNGTMIELQNTRSSLSFGAGKQRAALNAEISRVESLFDTVYFGNY